MRLKTRRTAIVAAGVTVLLGTAACGSSGPSSSNAGSGGGATAWALTGGDQPVFQASADAWNKAHPDEKVNFTFFAWSQQDCRCRCR
jgi:raffinose/stachyose/melibiose transport system substrate-binding protein